MICSICSDRAEGYHFGAVSCAACGAFFRRSISDQKVYSCARRGCVIVHDPTRRGGSCRFCRFEKCIISGMSPQEVRAKRATSNFRSPTFFRNIPVHTIGFIEQLVFLKRQINGERAGKEAPGNCDLPNLLKLEFEIMRDVSSKSEILEELLSQNEAFQNSSVSGFDYFQNDTFLVFFIYETCLITSSNGGVQLDRLIFTNQSFIELTEPGIGQFMRSPNNPYNLQTPVAATNCYNTFSFLVQVVAKNIQFSHLDETFLSILSYVVLSRSEPIHLRNPVVDSKRDNLLLELSKVEQTSSQFPDFYALSDQILQAKVYFKELMMMLFPQ